MLNVYFVPDAPEYLIVPSLAISNLRFYTLNAANIVHPTTPAAAVQCRGIADTLKTAYYVLRYVFESYLQGYLFLREDELRKFMVSRPAACIVISTDTVIL